MAENEGMGRDRDLVLPPNTYAYILDSTKGKVSAYVGPMQVSQSNTDRLVVWDTDKRRFIQVTDQDRAINTFQKAGEGQYVVLSNPALPSGGEMDYPPEGTSTDAVKLEVGRQVNVPGPTSFPLWPGQSATTIDGHHLRHNQYLVVRVYDLHQAQANWQDAVVAPQVGTDVAPTHETMTRPSGMGQLIVVQGTEVSFYIPPTGIEVVPEAGIAKTGTSVGTPGSEVFVREAVTLERLEYCILLDENGEKRYVEGPDVVFPQPTEQFVQKDGLRKFKAIELNPHSGLFIKVIAEHAEGGKTFAVGEELFITGSEKAIYFPRAEHSIIMYGDKRVHHAIAIPAGEGRYVLDRDKGTVDLVTGPKMFLPDPRKQVVVLRILDRHIVELYYPGNNEALEVNEHYAEISNRLDPGEHLSNIAASAAAAAYGSSQTHLLRSASLATSDFAGESMKRGTTYTPPRSIVLDTKYEGAVAVNVWPGYAVLVVNKTDDRRVEVGPKMVLLNYDEQLMPLTLSKGRPKDDKNTLRTAYLRVINNQVSDRVVCETRDLVPVTVDISYRVNFEAETQIDQQKWFAIENYVKVLTDHCRSRLRNEAKRYGIQEFYTGTIDIIRDTLLGASGGDEGRTGLLFPENGMRLYDVEVLNVQILEPGVADLLVAAQNTALTGAIELSTMEDSTIRTKRMQELERSTLDEFDLTSAKEGELALHGIARALQLRMSTVASQLKNEEEVLKVLDLTLLGESKKAAQEVAIGRMHDDARVQTLVAETTEYLRRMGALNEHVVVALQQFGDTAFVETLVKAVGPAAMATGISSADLLGQIFKDTPFAGALDALTARPLARVSVPRESAIAD